MLAKFYPLDRAEWLRACHKLTPSELDVLYFIRTSDPDSKGIQVDSTAIARDLSTPSRQVHRQTVSRALKSLVDKGFINPNIYGLQFNNQEQIESPVRDRLKTQLGGLAEVTTPAGRIDLLTATEIIEVKRIGDWKSALGQILVYSAFYPEHRKRLHLFGSAKDEKQLPMIELSCLAFDVLVSFEIVGMQA
jgi:MarR family